MKPVAGERVVYRPRRERVDLRRRREQLARFGRVEKNSDRITG